MGARDLHQKFPQNVGTNISPGSMYTTCKLGPHMQGQYNACLFLCTVSSNSQKPPVTCCDVSDTLQLPSAAGSCRKCGVNINTVLDRQCEESRYHSPCFSAVAHGYPDIIPLLLKDGLDVAGRACNEYLNVNLTSPYNKLSPPRNGGRLFSFCSFLCCQDLYQCCGNPNHRGAVLSSVSLDLCPQWHLINSMQQAVAEGAQGFLTISLDCWIIRCLPNVQLETGFSHKQQSGSTDVVNLLMLASCFGVPGLVSKLLEAGERYPLLPSWQP